MFENDMEGAIIRCDNNGCKIQGSKSAVLTLLGHIFKALIKSGLDKEDIEKALDIATMDDEQLNKELLVELRDFLENMQKTLDKKEEE